MSHESKLTPSQERILALALLGHRVKEIAVTIGWHEKSVRNQLTVIYHFEGVSHRAELLAKYILKQK